MKTANGARILLALGAALALAGSSTSKAKESGTSDEERYTEATYQTKEALDDGRIGDACTNISLAASLACASTDKFACAVTSGHKSVICALAAGNQTCGAAGVCIPTSACGTDVGFRPYPGLCSGGRDIQCCVYNSDAVSRVPNQLNAP